MTTQTQQTWRSAGIFVAVIAVLVAVGGALTLLAKMGAEAMP